MMTSVKGMKMLIGGEWIEKDSFINVYNPQDHSLITTVPRASKEDMLYGIEHAKEGAISAAKMPVHKRIAILNRAADFVWEHEEKFAQTISSEGSKTISEARSEVTR